MTWRRTFPRWLVTALLLGSPAMAVAHGYEANAVLYEVTEVMKLQGRDAAPGRRVATASLMGWIEAGTALCPRKEAAPGHGGKTCTLVATATDRLSLTTGKGPVRGTFAVVVQDRNAADGPEHAIIRGAINAEIDLSPALLSDVPLGYLRGTWTATAVRGRPPFKAKGRVTGVFRLPFVFPPYCAADGDSSGCIPVYLVPGTPGIEPRLFPGLHALEPLEFSLGVPTVRLELYFTDGS